MKNTIDCKNIQKYLKCIKCGEKLIVSYYKKEEGVITCSMCKVCYPIIKNVPRLLEGELLENCYYFYYDVIKENKILKNYFLDNLKEKKNSNKVEKLKSSTQKQFGYEWHIWTKLPGFVEDHFFNVMDKKDSFFLGKKGWDPATGNGHDLFNAAKLVGDGGFMVGSDISFAVDIAYERCKKLSNVLIVQADLYSDLLPDNYFDFAYMIGLIQHLTDPKKGIRSVFSKVKKGGYFVGTVYTKPEDFLSKMVVSFIYFMRFFTLKLPLPKVLFISRTCAIPAYLFFKLPKFVLNRFNYVKKMNELYPGHGTQQRRPNLDLLAHNWFDHFTPPVIGFYSDPEIRSLTKEINLEKYELRQGIFRGYKKPEFN